ncbi:hypothetical protein C0Q70_00285 [Pomacea canaliculata]|uniref:Hexosyltransferase n=1 Tax=Pomacea canaliculata TaxID=400727 RepID=A0A2T7PW77_POMCA|nr:hypothetical protein C0Q70_00285 [Pomacea canaliculata]
MRELCSYRLPHPATSLVMTPDCRRLAVIQNDGWDKAFKTFTFLIILSLLFINGSTKYIDARREKDRGETEWPACRMKMLWSYALLLLVLGVMLVIWTAGSYHTFVCTSLVKVSVAEVQGRLEDDLAEGHVAMSKATRHSDGEPSRGFSTNVSELSTVYRHSFRTNTPLEDHQLVLNSPYFRPRLHVVTSLVTKYLIEPEELCEGPEGSPLLLIFIPSVVTNVNMRRAIRAGWGRAAKGEWPGTRHLPPVKILFVFGRSGHVDEHAILWQEKEVWGDVLFADFTDTYRNLTVKVLTSLHYAATRCPATDFVLKVDEDTFVNVPYLLEFLRYHRKELSGRMVGYAINRPVSVRLGKWRVAAEAYPLPIFPKYLFGHSYLIHNSIVSDLVNLSQYMPFVPVEDATVTGILARALNVSRLHSSLFAFGKRGHTCAIVKNTKVTMTLVTEASHRLIWQAVESATCSYTLLNPDRLEERTAEGLPEDRKTLDDDSGPDRGVNLIQEVGHLDKEDDEEVI